MDNVVNFPLSNKCLALTSTTKAGNQALHVLDSRDINNQSNRHLLAVSTNLNFNNFTFVHQHHSDIILEAKKEDVGRGKDSFEDGLECDALYTKLKNVPLCIYHADCVPIFFIDEEKEILGIIHAGFKGTMKHIAFKAMQEVINKEKLDVKKIKFYIGPYRMPQSFMVDEETEKVIIEAGFIDTIKDHHFDNGLANILDLEKLGVEKSQIGLAKMDTFTDERFFSAYSKTKRIGRNISVIVLR